jgi:hypothetical protein
VQRAFFYFHDEHDTPEASCVAWERDAARPSDALIGCCLHPLVYHTFPQGLKEENYGMNRVANRNRMPLFR